MFLGTRGGIIQPPSHTFYRGYLPIPSKVDQKQPFGIPVYEPQMSKRLKATANILTVWVNSLKPDSYACVGQPSLKLCLGQNPQMRKNLGLRFDKESEGYLLSPMPPRGLVLNSRLRGASQILSIKRRIYLSIGPLCLNLSTYGEFTLSIPQVQPKLVDV